MYIRSISPIIATILIIVMTVAIAGIFYAFTTGLFGSLTQSSSQQIQKQSQYISFTINNIYCSNNIVYFNIYNNGNIPIDINNSQIIFTDNNGNTISINGSNIICNNGNIIPSGSNSLCYVENYICSYSYTDYIKSMNFVYNGISYSYNIPNNNNFNLVPPTFFQPTNPTISGSNSQGYLAQLPQCNINNNPYSGGGYTGTTGTYGLFSCIAINYGAISAVVWFYIPPGGQGVLISFQNTQYHNLPNNWVPWLYVGTNGYLYAGDWNGTHCQVSTPISTGWHMAVIEEWAASTSGPYYVALYLDSNYIGQSSTTNVPYLFGTNRVPAPQPSPYDDIGSGYALGWPATNGGWFFFNGTIAYVALYNTVLNQTQVQQLYQAGFPNTLFSNNLVISYILDPTYYNNNSYYFIPYYVNYQLMNQMGINNYNAISITPSGNVGPIPGSQFVYEPNPPIS
jgi:flagellin-like protein